MTSPTRRIGLSKSRLTAFEQCPKRLWLQVHRPDEAELDDGAELRFATGDQVGDAACAMYPHGVMIEAEPNLAAALDRTRELLAADHPGPLFEATFEFEGVLVRVDVMERAGDGWHIAEVKSSTRAKDYHLADLATQIWVLQNCGISVQSAAIRHVDREFVLLREGELEGLFSDHHCLEDIAGLIARRADIVAKARSCLDGEEPDLETGAHCSSPFECEFAAYCSRGKPAGPDWPVSLLPRGAGRIWQERGIDDLLALNEADLGGLNARILAATRSGTPYHDLKGANAAIEKWSWPRAWLDFETIAFAVPRWIGTRPYSQVPFQFSLHLEAEDRTMTHSGFLSTDGGDPRRACAEALIEQIPVDATIIAYNAGFERTVLRDLAAACPDLAEALLSMERRCVDLLPVTRAHWYHRDQRGSWSIKKVLPTMASLDYGGMEVKDGGDAQAAYLEAIRPDTAPDRHFLLREALEAYCERDTWAMVVIARGLTGNSAANGIARGNQ